VQHERTYHTLVPFLLEDMGRDYFNGDQDELALPLDEIVAPLQRPLYELLVARRDALAALSCADADTNPACRARISERHSAPAPMLWTLSLTNMPVTDEPGLSTHNTPKLPQNPLSPCRCAIAPVAACALVCVRTLIMLNETSHSSATCTAI